MYAFATLDPRPTAEAAEANAKVLGARTLGIEVTVDALAGQCGLGNIDPQHSGGNAELSAIESALTAELPAEGSTLVTVRADLDSVGAMAIFQMRADGIFSWREEDSEAWHGQYDRPGEYYTQEDSPYMSCDQNWLYRDEKKRLQQVAAADIFARGGYPGPQTPPTTANPWPEVGASASDSQSLAAIAAAVADFRVPLGDRVATMRKWLLTGEEPEAYRQQVEKERLALITALESGAIKHEVRANGRIAVVESTHRAATMVGYSLAPVVVARNPAFKQGAGEPYIKYTICAYEAKFADIKAALAELAELEAGWGGSPTIGGSPQGVSSILTTDQVAAIVKKHLK